MVAQGEAIHRLHDDIGNQQIHAAERRGVFQGLFARGGDAHFVSGQSLEDGEQRWDYARVVVDQQDSHCLSLSFGKVGGGGYCCASRSGSAVAA